MLCQHRKEFIKEYQTGHLSFTEETTRRHPSQIPKPYLHCFCLMVETSIPTLNLLPNNWAVHHFSKGDSKQPSEEAHFDCLYPQSQSSILNLFYSLPTACGRTLDYSFCVNIQYTVDQNTKGLWTIVGPVHISYKSCDKLLETLDSLYCETTLCRVFFFCSVNTSSRVNNHHIYTLIRDKPDSTP